MSNGNEKIKNIVLEIIVLIGDVSELYSIITNINSPFTVKTGISFDFQIDLYDVKNNKFSSQATDEPEITIISKLENSDNYPSPLGILDSNLNLANEYAGNSQSNFDGTYILKAGTYKMYINKKEIKSTPFHIEMTPTIIDADKCLNELLSSNIVNSSIIIQYQCRDMYGNNIQD